jgi:hypothetical protein
MMVACCTAVLQCDAAEMQRVAVLQACYMLQLGSAPLCNLVWAVMSGGWREALRFASNQ